MKLVDVNNEVFRIDNVNYNKGEFILHIINPESAEKCTINFINKYNNTMLFKTNVPFKLFRKLDDSLYNSINELSFVISNLIVKKMTAIDDTIISPITTYSSTKIEAMNDLIEDALDLKYDASNPNGYETPSQLNTRDVNNRMRVNHTGTQLASTISNFDSTVTSSTHAGRIDNPHSVTKTQVGLGSVDNTSDVNKPVSTAQNIAINAKVADSIVDGVTNIAPSQNIIYDKLIDIPYGSFSDSTSQTIASTTTAYPVKFNTDEIKNKITHSTVTNNSRIQVNEGGKYLFTFCAQGDLTSGSGNTIELWLAINGTNIPRTGIIQTIESNSSTTLITNNYILQMNANDYVEIYMKGSSTNVQLIALGVGSSPTRPAVPSIIATINRISE